MSYWFDKVIKNNNNNNVQYLNKNIKIKQYQLQSPKGTANANGQGNKEEEQWKRNQPRQWPQNNATSAAASAEASTSKLAACCVNSFLISAYHFISTFQRNGQVCGEKGRGAGYWVVHVQEAAFELRPGEFQARVKVSPAAKAHSHCSQKSANCNCLAANLWKCQIIQGQGNQDCTNSQHQGAGGGGARPTTLQERSVKLLKSELHVRRCFFFCILEKLALSGELAALPKHISA